MIAQNKFLLSWLFSSRTPMLQRHPHARSYSRIPSFWYVVLYYYNSLFLDRIRNIFAVRSDSDQHNFHFALHLFPSLRPFMCPARRDEWSWRDIYLKDFVPAPSWVRSNLFSGPCGNCAWTESGENFQVNTSMITNLSQSRHSNSVLQKIRMSRLISSGRNAWGTCPKVWQVDALSRFGAIKLFSTAVTSYISLHCSRIMFIHIAVRDFDKPREKITMYNLGISSLMVGNFPFNSSTPNLLNWRWRRINCPSNLWFRFLFYTVEAQKTSI